jgi:multidrug resistance efflux pump
MSHPQVAEQTVRQAPSAPAPERRDDNVNADGRDTPAVKPVTRVEPQPQETARNRASLEEGRSPGGRGVALRWILAGFKRLATLAIALVAIIMALVTWDYYVTAPWTRDGRLRVQVASVAPQVSGQITELRVGDNQYVHKGDVLYVIDPFDFEVALRVDKAQSQQRAADLQVKQVQSERRQRLTDLATTPEEQQTFAGSAVQAKAAFEAAQQQVAQAEINLRRTQVRSPVNGYVTNLLMRLGDYAHEGAANISVIDTDSFWIDGYFEETKLARVCIGDLVEAKLMGYAEPILGHVASVTRGIVVSDAAAGAQGLPNVNPVFTWDPPRATRARSRRDRSCSSGRAARLRLDRDGDDQGGSHRPPTSIMARPRHRGSWDPAVGCPDESACPARMHSGDDDRAGGRGKVGGHSGRDQSRPRARHRQVAKERELIMRASNG